MRASGLAVVACLALAALVTSCAQLPAPRPAQPPPVPTPETRPAAPVAQAPEAAPGPLERREEPFITVGLAWDLDSLTIVPLMPVDLIVGRGDVYGAPTTCAGFGQAFTIRCEGEAADFDGGLGSGACRTRIAAGDTLKVIDASHGPWSSPRAVWNGRHWRGLLQVFVNSRGKLTLVDRLPLETYLLGVVPLEIGGLTKDLLEAGRAQAVAARSYTLFYRGRRASEGFDLYGTVEDQVYGPVESERPLATECVERTRGEVALHEGQPIRANYCSTCGGVSAEVWEAWPAAALPYLESRRDGSDGSDYCASSPLYRWRERWSEEEFLEDLERFGPAQKLRLPPGGLGDLLDVRVDARSRSGRVWRLTVRTTTGDVTIPSYAIRGALRRGGSPGSILRSNLFKIDVRRHPVTGRALEVVASGAGSGHGVGLCQTGALGMARAGATAEEILGHYYPHSVLERLY
jgi:stage II sporulation protein D